MFGYVVPMRGELRVSDFTRYKACYCGLCRALGRKYGLLSRMILSFDFVFLAMLLWPADAVPVMGRKRCAASMCRKRPYCVNEGALDICAGYSVILFRWKLIDSIEDEGFFRSLPYRFMAMLLSGAYKNAAREYAEFDKSVRERLRELSEYEAAGGRSLDGAADKFALLLSAAAPEDEKRHRPMEQLLYHVGRWIYIVDAIDDFDGDMKRRRYNPLSERFSERDGLSEDALDRLKTTLTHSSNLSGAAFELLPENPWSETVRNILSLGMPSVCKSVISGTWKGKRIRANTDKDMVDYERSV